MKHRQEVLAVIYVSMERIWTLPEIELKLLPKINREVSVCNMVERFAPYVEMIRCSFSRTQANGFRFGLWNCKMLAGESMRTFKGMMFLSFLVEVHGTQNCIRLAS